jgi:hypothetical protein
MIIDDKSNVCYLGDIIKQDDGSSTFVATHVAIMHEYQTDEDGDTYLDRDKMTDRALEILSLKDKDSFPRYGSIDEVFDDIKVNSELSKYLTDERTQEILDSIQKSKNTKINWLPYVNDFSLKIGSIVKYQNGGVGLVGDETDEFFNSYGEYEKSRTSYITHYSNDLVDKIQRLLNNIVELNSIEQ